MEYIQDNKIEAGCIFCKLLSLQDSPDNLIVYRGNQVYVILNRYPYTSGHIMVVPYHHCSSLEELNSESRSELMEVTSQAISILSSEYHPQGYNLGMNIGEAAGAGIVDHIHLHIVPRWVGDTNFMSSVASTRVLPELLEDTYLRIRNRWLKLPVE